jgi:hypothetical protein
VQQICSRVEEGCSERAERETKQEVDPEGLKPVGSLRFRLDSNLTYSSLSTILSSKRGRIDVSTLLHDPSPAHCTSIGLNSCSPTPNSLPALSEMPKSSLEQQEGHEVYSQRFGVSRPPL